MTQDGDDDDGDVEIQEVKKEKKPVIKKRAASDSPVKKGKKPAAKKSKAEPKKREKKEVVEPPRKVTIHLQQVSPSITHFPESLTDERRVTGGQLDILHQIPLQLCQIDPSVRVRAPAHDERGTAPRRVPLCRGSH